MKNKNYPLYELPYISDMKELVRSKAENTPDKPAFTYSEKKEIITKNFKNVCDDVNALGSFLYSKGLKNSHIGIIGENSYEWIAAFLAIINGGNTAVPIDKEQSPEKIKELLTQADCTAVFVSKNYTDTVSDAENITVLHIEKFPEYLDAGRTYDKKSDFENFKTDPDALAAIFFTSGTTGNNKGVMLSHKNMASDINYACKNFKPDGNTLSVLPFHHSFGLLTAIFAVYNYGYSSHLNNNLKKIQKDLCTVKPQTIFLVPLFVETFYKMVYSTAKKNNMYKKLKNAEKLSGLLLNCGIDVRKKLFKSVLSSFGGNLEYIICGGAMLDTKYIKAFELWGIDIMNGYGITECAPVVSVNRNHYKRYGSIGQIIKCCEVKISDDNEILIKGDNVMLGYYKNEKETEAVLKNSWFYTGDLGYIDKDGFLFLTGRKKNLIIMSNGENVSPEGIEEKILKYDSVNEVIVSGKNGILISEIYPSEEYLNDNEHFEKIIAEINKNQPAYMQIQKIKLRDTEFPKNSSKKIIRHNIEEDKK